MRFVTAICLILLFACSSKRTQYQKFEKKEGGYSDAVTEDHLHVTKFEGNSLTKKSYAELFAKFHSLEECRKTGSPYSHIIGVIDKSSTKKVIRSNSDAWGPSYYYGMGMSPFYSRYSGFGFSTGINMVNSRAWEETLVYPEIDVIYHCTEKVYEPEIAMRDVPAEEMKHLVKDLKGGVQVEKILPGSPNTALKQEDIIIKAEGKRIMKGHELLALFKDGPDPVKALILREGEKKTVKIRAEDVTKKVEKNLAEIRASACKFEDVEKASSLCKEKL
jgi:hypothetical protein